MLPTERSTGRVCQQTRCRLPPTKVGRIPRDTQKIFGSALLLCFVLCAVSGGCRDRNSPTATAADKAAMRQTLSWDGRTMGTTYRVVVWAPASDKGSREALNQSVLTRAVEKRLARINQCMSTYQPDSELSQFNATKSRQWFSVSPETAHVVKAAKGYHQATNGALDVTIGPLMELWGFDPTPRVDQREPTHEQLQEVLKRVGSQHLKVRIEGDGQAALQKMVEGLHIDVSALAKGYAVDQIVALLAQSGAAGGLVEIGGEVRTWGLRADGRMWRIGIENPLVADRRLAEIITLDNASLATSGDYRNFRSFPSGSVSHLIDPSTGVAQPTGPRSVSVCAKTCIESDALATALFLMGQKRGLAWSEDHGVAAMFLTIENGKLRTVFSSHFAPYFEPQ